MPLGRGAAGHLQFRPGAEFIGVPAHPEQLALQTDHVTWLVRACRPVTMGPPACRTAGPGYKMSRPDLLGHCDRPPAHGTPARGLPSPASTTPGPMAEYGSRRCLADGGVTRWWRWS